MTAETRHRRWRDVAIKNHLTVATAMTSRQAPPSTHHTPTAMIPPPTQETPMMDTPMAEAPDSKPALTTDKQLAATAGGVDQVQPRQDQQHAAAEQVPPMTEFLPASTFPREHPPREPTSRQSISRLYDDSPPDRKPSHFSTYPTASDSLSQTPYLGMSTPSKPRARTDTSSDKIPHLASYPTAPESTSQTPQPGTSQQRVSATGWLVPPPKDPTSKITFEDYLSLSEITFEWGDSYDDKDWMRLRAILAPTLMVDYSQVNGHVWSSMPAEEFVRVMSNIGFVGDPLVHTQHHIGASKWAKISDDEAIGHHQLRAAHQRYTGLDLKTVENKGQGHAMVKHFYRKVDGEWKLAGLRPTVRWNEFEFEKDF